MGETSRSDLKLGLSLALSSGVGLNFVWMADYDD